MYTQKSMAHASGTGHRQQAPVPPCPSPQAPSSLSSCSPEGGVLLDGGLQQYGHSSAIGHCWADATKIRGQDQMDQPPVKVSGSGGSWNIFMANKLKNKSENEHILAERDFLNSSPSHQMPIPSQPSLHVPAPSFPHGLCPALSAQSALS